VIRAAYSERGRPGNQSPGLEVDRWTAASSLSQTWRHGTSLKSAAANQDGRDTGRMDGRSRCPLSTWERFEQGHGLQPTDKAGRPQYCAF